MGEVWETFDKADSTVLGPNHTWTKENGSTDGLKVVSNQLSSASGATTADLGRCEESMDSVDHKVSVNIAAMPVSAVGSGNATCAIFARLNDTGAIGGTGTYYRLEMQNSTANGHRYAVAKFVNGTQTALRVATAVPAGVVGFPGRLELQVEGSTVRSYYKGTLLATFTDTSIPGGSAQDRSGCQIYQGNNATKLDDFRAGVMSFTVAPFRYDAVADNFTGDQLNDAQWGPSFSNGYSFANGQALLDQETTYSQITSENLDWNPNGETGQVFCQMIPAQNLSNSREDALAIQHDTNNRAELLHTGTSFRYRTRNAGVYREVTLSYDSVAHRWRRIRIVPAAQVSGQDYPCAYFDVSPDGKTWTTLNPTTPFPVTWNVRSAYIRLWAGTYNTGETPGLKVAVDNVNVTGQDIALSGSLTPTGLLVKTYAPKVFTGSLTPAGVLVQPLKVAYKELAGTVAVTGLLLRGFSKSFSGSTTPTGGFTKVAQLLKTGSAQPTGVFSKAFLRVITGSLAGIAGAVEVLSLGRSYGRSGIVSMTVRAAGELRLRLRRAH